MIYICRFIILKFEYQPCMLCNKKEYFPIFCFSKRRTICKSCFSNKYDELKNKYDLTSKCLFADDD